MFEKISVIGLEVMGKLMARNLLEGRARSQRGLWC